MRCSPDSFVIPLQVTGGVQYLDSLCDGLNYLLVKVPALKSYPLSLYSNTMEAAVSMLALSTTYLATTMTLFTAYLTYFPLVQVILRVTRFFLASLNDCITDI